MKYLDKYGTKRRMFQGGGQAPLPADPAAQAPAGPGPEGGGGEQEQVIALAQATMSGDQAAAAQLGQLLAPMIMQEVEAAQGGGGGAPAAPAGPEGQPVFRKGGAFAGNR